MPVIIAGANNTKSGSLKWVDARGKTSTLRQAGFPGTTTEAQITAVQNAMGALSNAAQVERRYTNNAEASIAASTAYDDAESSVRSGANVTFQNTVTLVLRSFRFPAPHLSHIDLSGGFLKDRAADAAVETLVAALETALGASWVYVNSPISTYADGTDTQVERPLVAEPP